MELCQILYSEEYSSTMERLGRCLEQKIYTEESLQLTKTALDLLASHYTTWHYRLEIVRHLNKDLFAELDWCELVALDNQKNYQIWNYRQNIIEEILKSPETAARFDHKREYPILAMMLEQDSKNHHVWSYRKWFVERFGLHKNVDEISFTTALIEQDLRNNSAWTHRFFLKFKSGDISPADADAEIDFVKSHIDICPQNPSTWNYLNGIYSQLGLDITNLKDFAAKYAEVKDGVISSTYALELLAKIATKEDVKEADRIYTQLAETYDPMRANYWNYLREKLDT